MVEAVSVWLSWSIIDAESKVAAFIWSEPNCLSEVNEFFAII